MGLTVPVPGPGGTPGPTYAVDVSDDLDIISQHDHSSGKGNPVHPNGLDIDADLSFGGFNALDLNSGEFVNLNSPITGATTNVAYFSGGNLWINDGSGNQIQLTKDGALNVSALGNFTNLAGTTGEALYTSGSGLFTFTSNTNVKATLSTGPLKIATTTASAASITIQSPVLASGAYTITLPTKLPVSPQQPVIMTMDGSGNVAVDPTITGNALTGVLYCESIQIMKTANTLSPSIVLETTNALASGYAIKLPDTPPVSVTVPLAMDTTGALLTDPTNLISTVMVQAGAITAPKLGALNYGISAHNSASFSTTSATFVAVDDGSGHNIAVTITTTSGRPMMVFCQPAGSSPAELLITSTSGSSNPLGQFQFAVTGAVSTSIGTVALQEGTLNGQIGALPGSLMVLFPGSGAGTYTFTLQALAGTNCTVAVSNTVIVAYEIS